MRRFESLVEVPSKFHFLDYSFEQLLDFVFAEKCCSARLPAELEFVVYYGSDFFSGHHHGREQGLKGEKGILVDAIELARAQFFESFFAIHDGLHSFLDLICFEKSSIVNLLCRAEIIRFKLSQQKEEVRERLCHWRWRRR